MIRTPFVASALVAALAFTSSAMAETAAAPAAAKPAAAKPAAKAAAKPAAAPVAKALPAADAEQLTAAERTYFGLYECEFDQKVDIGMNPKSPGYVDVSFKGKTYTMKPVLSSTGALRLEDVAGRTLMLQIANKSMLMDTKIGQRMVDNCVHPQQAKFTKAQG